LFEIYGEEAIDKTGAMRCGFDISDQNRKTKFSLKRIFVSG